MERPKPSTLAWTGLAVGVAAYDFLCPPGETLSEGVDRALETRVGRVLALGGIAIVASHLANMLPERYDPLHQLTKLKLAEAVIQEVTHEREAHP